MLALIIIYDAVAIYVYVDMFKDHNIDVTLAVLEYSFQPFLNDG